MKISRNWAHGGWKLDVMRRACKAGLALIAEGFAKRYQKRQWMFHYVTIYRI